MLHSSPIETLYTVEIMPELRHIHGDRIRPEIISVKIVHSDNDVFMDITITLPREADLQIRRINIKSIGGIDGPDFKAENPIQQNASDLAHLDGWSLVNYTKGLFSDEGAQEIADEYHMR
jgi:hypothetical protein